MIPTFVQSTQVKMQLQLWKYKLPFSLNSLFALHLQFCFIECHMAYYSKYPVTTGNENSSDLWHKTLCLLKRGKHFSGNTCPLGTTYPWIKDTIISLITAGLALFLEHKEQLAPQYKTSLISICCPKQILHCIF